ncbi:MAG: orotidine-5'-phosphate decarboxylase [Promethearchaeota archaeon]
MEVTGVNALERLDEKMQELECFVCLGMDPRFTGKALIPPYIVKEHDGDKNEIIKEFNTRILEGVAGLVPAIKPQMAYYAAWGAWDALEHTISLAKKLGIMVILDGKRNDIGSTSEAYARAMFETLGADCATVNPYLGTDCIEPFLERPGTGIFVLVKTSNPSSREIQDLFSVSLPGIPQDVFTTTIAYKRGLELERNYVKVARLVNQWNSMKENDWDTFGPAGAVVGATFPAQLKYLRSIMKHSLFLIPGFGFQGGNPESVKHGFLPGRSGSIVNSSRALLYAYSLSKQHSCAPDKFEEATAKELISMNENILKALET